MPRKNPITKGFAIGSALLIYSILMVPVAALPIPPSGTLSVIDATGRTVQIETPIERVVTINTSSAIILRALGVDIEKTIVGVTSYITENPRFWPSLKDKPAFKFTNINYENLKEKNLKNTAAGKNGRILLIAQDLKQGPAYVIALALFAGFLHPEIFADINPADIAEEYHEKWCRLPHQGVYVYPEHPFNKEDTEVSHPQKSGSGSTVSVIDSAGRKIKLSVPVGTIACLHTSGCRQLSLLGLDDRVVGVTAYISDDPGLYPRLKNKPDIGSVYAPNYEIILENQPDILIMGSAPVNLAAAVTKLEPAGIKVLALDLQPREGADAFQREKNYDHQLMLLATITGTEDRAREFITWKQDIFEMIRRRTHDVEKVRVLCVNSVSKVLQDNGISAWAGERIIELAGGINPAADLEGKEISAEWILEQDPDVIAVVGYWPGEGLGYGVSGTDRVEKTFGQICANKVFHKTRAVKDKNLYLFAYYGLASGGQTPIGALYLAKRLYPERFADLDPAKYHREFLEKWFDVAYRGIWFYP